MSRQGERIGRRLAKRHSLKFDCDPCNFLIVCDREAVVLNTKAGLGTMQWVVKVDCCWYKELPKVWIDGGWKQAEIGCDYGASTVLKWKHWNVVFDRNLSGPGLFTAIIWIDESKGEDRTKWG